MCDDFERLEEQMNGDEDVSAFAFEPFAVLVGIVLVLLTALAASMHEAHELTGENAQLRSELEAVIPGAGVETTSPN